MLRLILGPDWVANRDEVLRRIARDVKERKPGRILMVPELISHDMERRVCAAAGDTASRYAEVLSFTRLLRRVAEAEVLTPEKCLDNGGRLVAMASATRGLSSKLKSYASVETKPEFLAGLLDAVDEFKRCCISAEDLSAASTQTDGSLAQKLEELSLILQSYDAVCAQGSRDPRDQMNWLLERLEECDFGANHTFYIDGFPDFTRQHLAILTHLIRVAPCVTVSLNCDRIRSGKAAFEKAGQTASELYRAATELGVAVEIVEIPGRRDALSLVRDRLFQGPVEPCEELKEHLFLTRSDSVFDECSAAAEQIMALVSSGCRYRDIGIVCTDMQQYRGILSLVFHRSRIPVYLSGSDDILQKAAVATVLCGLDAAIDGLDQRDVLRFLKSALSPLSPEMCDRIENYAILWGIRGEKWNQEWTLHPGGLGAEWSDRDREKLERLNEARRQGVEPLARLRTGLYRAADLAEQVRALYRFLEEISLARELEHLARQADLRGDNRTAQEYNQLWEILLSALEQLTDVLGRSKWEPETFSRLFRLLLSQYDVGTIPTVLDAVSAGPVSAMRCQQVKHLFVLGSSEGLLPSYAGSAGVLTDQERTELRRLGVPLTGGAMEGVAAEFAEIYGCFCGADQTIRLSCSGEQTAYVYRRLCGLVGLKEGVSVGPGPGPALADPWEAGAYLARWKQEELVRALGAHDGYREALAGAAYRLGQVEPDRTRELYGNKLTLSASQIDRQAECRLSYFLRYGLRAQERKEATVDPAEFGTYVHAVLEETAKEIKQMGGFHQVTLEQTLEIAHRHAARYADERFSQLDSQRLQYLFKRNSLELDAVVVELWEELSRSLFEPVEFELSFGADSQMPAVAIPGKAMDAQLRGFVDRVDQFRDAYRNFFRVVDYKTGKKDFDYCDVFNGVGLQMLLYLFALEQGGEEILGDKPRIAGVQYFPARFPFMTADGRLSDEDARKERAKELKRPGLILLDDDVLAAMDPDEDMKRLSCRRKSDGTVTGDVANPAQFRLLREYVFRLLGRMVDSIAAGHVEPNPYTRGSAHSACAFCPYGAVCARERESGRRNYKTMTAQRFWEEIGKEVSHGE